MQNVQPDIIGIIILNFLWRKVYHKMIVTEKSKLFVSLPSTARAFNNIFWLMLKIGAVFVAVESHVAPTSSFPL